MIAPEMQQADPLGLAALGLRIFPAHNIYKGRCSCGNRQCPSPGKHPRISGWQAAATTDPAQIQRWRKAYPYANWGIAIDPGDMVLDEDPRNGGEESLQRLDRDIGGLPDTWRVLTGGGGEHHYYRLPPDMTVRSGPLEGYPGLDVKAADSLVIAPGSVHASGRRYEWDLAAHPEDMPRAEAPAALIAIARKGARQAPRNGEELVIPQGKRHDTFVQEAGRMREWGYPVPVIRAALHALNEECCHPPLPNAEVESIAAGAGKWERGTLDQPPDPVVAERALASTRKMQSATVRGLAHSRARKYVPVATRFASLLIQRKEQGKPPDTEDGLYYISKEAIGGKDVKTGEWDIKEGTVKNHMADLREYAPHIPGFRAAKRLINFPKKEVDAETGETVAVDRWENTWCYNFDGDPADLVGALPTLPFPEDGRGGPRCPGCGSKKLRAVKWVCQDCGELTDKPTYDAPEEGGQTLPPPSQSNKEADSEGGGYSLTPIGNTSVPIPMGGKVCPHPQEPTQADWEGLYQRAEASTPRLVLMDPAEGHDPPPAVECTARFLGCVCAHPARCAEKGRCSP